MKKILRIIGTAVRELIWVAIAVAVVFGGFQGFRYLKENREVVTPAPVERPIALVETVSISAMQGPLEIRGEGFVRPFRQANLAPQTGGQIVELHPAIINRGSFKKGDILARLDDSQQRAALRQADANVTSMQARVNLNTLQLDRTEKLMARGATTQQALDQITSARAELLADLASVQAAQQSAKVFVDQKTVRAPFDGAVLSRTAEIGTVLNGGQAIAEIFTQERMEIEVSIREADAALIPGLFDGRSAPARVNMTFAGRALEWDAHVSRVAPALDPQTRTLSVTVELENVNAPRQLDVDALASGNAPALINAFANVTIEGEQLDGIYAVPSTSVRGGSDIWAFAPTSGDAGTLNVLQVDVVHVDGETSYVRPAKSDGALKLITTALPAAREDLPLRDVAQVQHAALSNVNPTE